MCVYIYIYIYIHTHMCMFRYIYREREREGEYTKPLHYILDPKAKYDGQFAYGYAKRGQVFRGEPPLQGWYTRSP